jgi:hypothetical protein
MSEAQNYRVRRDFRDSAHRPPPPRQEVLLHPTPESDATDLAKVL